MGIWYRNGTVSLNNNSAAVAGVGTAFVANVQPGDGLYVGGDLYEIASIAGNTQLTLERPYQGASLSNVGYAIMPTRGVTKQAADAMFGLIGAVEGFRDGPLAGRFTKGTLAAPSLRSPTDGNTGVNIPDGDQIELITNAIRRVLLTTAAMQVDVPITGNAVQSSPYDAAANKLMKNGAHGLGAGSGGVTFVSNLDDVNTPVGFYAVNASSTGTRPSGSSSFAFLVVLRQSTTGIMQLWVNSNGLLMAYRTSTSGTWDLWSRIYDQRSILGTVSQAAGVPTGAIIEGPLSSALGEYVRLAGGLQICWCPVSSEQSIGVAHLGGFRSPNISFNFPAPFSSVPSLYGCAAGGTAFGIMNNGSNTTTAGSFNFTAVTSQGSATRTAMLTAIGRWS